MNISHSYLLAQLALPLHILRGHREYELLHRLKPRDGEGRQLGYPDYAVLAVDAVADYGCTAGLLRGHPGQLHEGTTFLDHLE